MIKTFSTGERAKIEDDRKIKFLSFSLEKSFDFFDFSEGYLPVFENKKSKFYNIKGEVVKDFGDKFHSFTCPVDGVYHAYYRNPESRNSFMNVYIDQNFDEKFSDQRFWKATNMFGGYSFAQLSDENGPWAVLDYNSGNIKNLDTKLSKNIKNIVRNSKGHGIIKI